MTKVQRNNMYVRKQVRHNQTSKQTNKKVDTSVKTKVYTSIGRNRETEIKPELIPTPKLQPVIVKLFMQYTSN